MKLKTRGTWKLPENELAKKEEPKPRPDVDYRVTRMSGNVPPDARWMWEALDDGALIACGYVRDRRSATTQALAALRDYFEQ
jgi:hypothetical protein